MDSARPKIGAALGVLFLACLSLLLLRLADPAERVYLPAAAGYEVRSADVALHDVARHKQVRLRISYPLARGTFPVIIFSHGAGHSHRDYSRLIRYWTSHGYICIQPEHHDSLSLRPVADPARAQAQVASDIRDPKIWVDRVADDKFMLSALPLLAAAIPEVAVRMTAARVGIAGHSLGAHTTAVLAGAKIDLPGVSGLSNLATSGISAALVMSGHGRGELGLRDASWSEISMPMMVITGSRDIGFFRRPAAWREEAYWFAPPPNKYLVTFEGASHSAFTGMGHQEASARLLRIVNLATDYDARAFTCTQAATLAFWDAYLKVDAAALMWLKSNALTRTPCRASLQRK
jgi:dienelactone hydrolase